MRYSPELYAKAFLETAVAAGKQKQGELVRRFLKVVKKNGDSILLGKIFRLIQEALVRRKGGRIITLEFSREVSEKLSAKLRSAFSKKDYIEEFIRPDLVAGARILVDGKVAETSSHLPPSPASQGSLEELDMTMRKKLKKLF